jgi:hypothetical protein
MKYETFTEIADDLKNGYSVFHRITSKHDKDDCFAWQKGIEDFAKWLDENGYIVANKPSDLYSN